jgi:CRISPR/Cas system-associated exonuclease Cas4 (RecB family)
MQKAEHLKYGTIIHLLLSEINHPVEIEQQINKYENVILKQQLDKRSISEKLHQVLSLPILKYYFDGTFTIKKEVSILNKRGEILRPDLIAIKNNIATIIDYKTGAPNESYTEQIDEYAGLLQEMGYEIKERIIVYIDDENIVNV